MFETTNQIRDLFHSLFTPKLKVPDLRHEKKTSHWAPTWKFPPAKPKPKRFTGWTAVTGLHFFEASGRRLWVKNGQKMSNDSTLRSVKMMLDFFQNSNWSNLFETLPTLNSSGKQVSRLDICWPLPDQGIPCWIARKVNLVDGCLSHLYICIYL